MTFAAGETVAFETRLRGELWARFPARVVLDDGDRVVLWWTKGTRSRVLDYTDRLQALDLLQAGGWPMTEHEHYGGDMLLIARIGEPFTFWPFRSDDGELLCWYVNLQEPLRRTDAGFETCDRTLDLVLSPDRTELTWKDEDELEYARSIGLYTEADVVEIQASGQAALEAARDRGHELDLWGDWRPDPAWPIPDLPDLWAD